MCSCSAKHFLSKEKKDETKNHTNLDTDILLLPTTAGALDISMAEQMESVSWIWGFRLSDVVKVLIFLLFLLEYLLYFYSIFQYKKKEGVYSKHTNKHVFQSPFLDQLNEN